MQNRLLYFAVVEVTKKAAQREGALNARDRELLAPAEPDPLILGQLLLKMRKRDALRPSDLTELRVAVQDSSWCASALGNDFQRAIAETWLENEVRKETPRKR